MTGLGLGLPKLIISSSYSHRLMLHMLARAWTTVSKCSLKLPSQSKQIYDLAHALSRLNFSLRLHLCSSLGSALSPAHPSPLPSFILAAGISSECPAFPPACLLVQLTKPPSPDTEVFEKTYPSTGLQPSSTKQPRGLQHKNNKGLLEWIQRSHEDDLRAGAPLL